MTINDREWLFLAQQTGEPGPFNDMYFKYLRGLGYTGTLQDMIAAFGEGYTPSRIVTSLNSLMAAQADGLYFDTTKTDRFFQENTGPTLADDVGEAMGLALSQRAWNGQTLAELLAGQIELRGTGTTATLGTATAATYNTSTGAGSVSRVDGSNLSAVQVAITPGKRYAVDIETFGLPVYIRDNTGFAVLATTASTGRQTFYVSASGTPISFTATSAGTTTFTLHSFKEVPGKHGIQATGTLKPLRQTTGAKFDGLDDNWLTSYTAGAGENFIVALVTVPSTVSATQILCGAQGSGPSRAFLAINPGGAVRAGVAGVSAVTGGSALLGQTVVIGMTFNATDISVFADDAEVATDVVTGSLPPQAFRVGALNNEGTASSFFAGSIKKLVAGRQFLDLATYRRIRAGLLAV